MSFETLEYGLGEQPDPLAVALGYKNWNYNPSLAASASAFATQTIYAIAVYLPPGTTVTGVALDVLTAGVGVSPTGFFVGLASPAAMVAQSGNIIGAGAEAGLKAQGRAQLPFTAPYVTNNVDSPTGLYYIIVLENGAYATTPLAVGRGVNNAGSGNALGAANPLQATIGVGQIALPANGNAIALAASGIGFHAGVY